MLVLILQSLFITKTFGFPKKDTSEQFKPSVSKYIAGGLLGVWPGFGVGHAIQGRYFDSGWIYTAGEAGALLAGYYGCKNTRDAGGGCALLPSFIFMGFKITEIYSVWNYSSYIESQRIISSFINPIDQKIYLSINF